MRTRRPGTAANPSLYREFKNAQEIANVINRSKSYVFKALNEGFTEREKQMLEDFAQTVIFDD